MVRIMAIVNATPDSYYAPSRILNEPQALHMHAIQEYVDAGADILDIGGESSRPGAEGISLEEELYRVCPVIESAKTLTSLPLSIDTVKPEVARAAIARGATMINDISGFSHPDMIQCLVEHPQVEAVVMHMKGTPKTMQKDPVYPQGVVREVFDFFSQRLEELERKGVSRKRVILDPGIGFGKTLADNLALMRAARQFKSLGCPLLYGVSRKGWLGAVTGRAVEDRLAGTLAAASYLIMQGVDILRVHDVAAHADVRSVCNALCLPETEG